MLGRAHIAEAERREDVHLQSPDALLLVALARRPVLDGLPREAVEAVAQFVGRRLVDEPLALHPARGPVLPGLVDGLLEDLGRVLVVETLGLPVTGR
ncbi:hypothetical protein [Streptomyces sp. NPDC047453]|uniref:hypothetical protein n=1 Tax=Streptomyces sp. NPDC047453 TaxID=3154812 RepID=UPI0033DC9EB2